MNMPILMILTFTLLFLHLALRKISYNGMILTKGENFSVKEKKKLLEALDAISSYYKDNKSHGTFSVGMCNDLDSEIYNHILYNKLCKTYHNPEYYRKMGLQTNIDITRDRYWWNTRDFASRYKATLILKNAIIND